MSRWDSPCFFVAFEDELDIESIYNTLFGEPDGGRMAKKENEATKLVCMIMEKSR
jgi:hypothetical protein